MAITLIKQSIPIIVVILILTIIYLIDLTESQHESALLNANQCYLSTVTCEFEFEGHNFKVNYDRFPLQIEEMLPIVFIHSSEYLYNSSWVEGTNMFMGKMNTFTRSIITDKQQGIVELDLFLGACSEPQMRWKMVLNLTHIASGKPKRLIVFFQTDQS